MTAATRDFDTWLGGEFVERNTDLEEAYLRGGGRLPADHPELAPLREALLLRGAELVARIADDGRLPTAAGERYHLLGSIGFYLAACRRHQADTGPAASAGPGGEAGPGGRDAGPLRAAWSLANQLGTALGVAPRFVFAHQSLHGYRLFTALDDERIFVTQNALGVAAYQRAADALRRIAAMGVTSPVVTYLLSQARAALDDVLRFNRALSTSLDVDRFFHHVRPYFAPYRVGTAEYRGVNAGDFAAINEIDVRLGLCRPDDPFYQHVLIEKYPYVPPEDQAALRAVVDTPSLLELFATDPGAGRATARWRENAELFLQVCRAHGAAYTFHHHRLVKPFLVEPAAALPNGPPDGITASGPPLRVVFAELGRLADLRAARDRPGRTSARADLDRLRRLISAAGG